MPGDFSRSTFDPRKHYRSVQLQQGRVQLDADWNEQADLVEHAARTRMRDLVGGSGCPEESPGFELTATHVLHFGGHGDFVEIKLHHAYPFHGRHPFTIEAVVHPDAGRGGTILSAGRLSLHLGEDGRLVFEPGHGPAVTTDPCTWTAARHVAVVDDGKHVRIYVDGKRVGAAQRPHHAGGGAPLLEVAVARETIDLARLGELDVALFRAEPEPEGEPTLRIGAAGGTPGESFAGTIGAVRLWKMPWSDHDLLALRVRPTREEPGLAGAWMLDDGPSESGQRDLARDLSPHHNDGLLRCPGGHRPRWQLTGLEVGGGRYYVDGILCENEATVALDAQPDSPGDPLPKDDGLYVVALDTWERAITAIEDPALREEALGGLDTTVRVKTVWQVRAVRVDDDPHARDAGPEAPAFRAFAPRAEEQGLLRARRRPQAQQTELPGNLLYRVEIHDPGAASPSPGRPVATFTWSRNNGIDALPILSAGGHQVKLAEPVGQRVDLAAGAWVEIADDRSVLRGEPRPLRQVVAIADNRRDVTLGGAPLDPLDASTHPLLRRWDQGAAARPSGVLPAAGEWTELEHGIEVQFAGPGGYRTGNYWLLPARRGSRTVQWPADAQGPALVAPGGKHHTCRLALLRIHEGGASLVDLRRVFSAMSHVSVLEGPITVRGALHVTGEATIGGEAIVRLLKGELPARSVQARELAEAAVTGPKLAPESVHARHFSPGSGFVPEGFFILGPKPVAPPGFAYTHAQVEVQNPAPAWEPQPALPASHHGRRVIVVAVGEALFALTEEGHVLRSDEAAPGWTPFGEPLDAPHRGFAAAAVGDHLHVVGGVDARGLPSARHAVFDTGTGEWKEASKLPTARAHLSAAALDGALYAIGGSEGVLPFRLRDALINLGLPASLFAGRRSSDAVEAFDPASRRWYVADPLPTPRGNAGATVLHGRIHVIGGSAKSLLGAPEPSAEHEVLTPARNTWEGRMPLPAPRGDLGVAAVEGRIYATGGLGGDPPRPVAQVDVYDPVSDTWSAGPPLPQATHDHGMAALYGDVFVVGGTAEGEPAGTVLSCAAVSTLFVHRKIAVVTPELEAPRGEGEGAGARRLGRKQRATLAAQRSHTLERFARPSPGRALVTWALLAVAFLAIAAALYYGYGHLGAR